MKKRYLPGIIIFSILSVFMILAFISTAASGELSLNAVPAGIATLVFISLAVWFAVKFSAQNTDYKKARKSYRTNFRPTIKSKGVWVDENNKLWQTRYTFIKRIYHFSELSDYHILKGYVHRTHYGRSDSVTFNDYSYIGIEIKLKNRKRIRMNLLPYSAGVYKAFDNAEDTAEVLNLIKRVNQMDNNFLTGNGPFRFL